MFFDDNGCSGMKKIDLFKPYVKPEHEAGKMHT
jgi:hypothetical protein